MVDQLNSGIITDLQGDYGTSDTSSTTPVFIELEESEAIPFTLPQTVVETNKLNISGGDNESSG